MGISRGSIRVHVRDDGLTNEQVQALIDVSTANLLTQEQIAELGYQTASEVQTVISASDTQVREHIAASIADLLSQEQITELGYQTASEVQAAISASESFIFIRTGDFPVPTADNTDKVLVDVRGGTQQLYGNKVVTFESAPATVNFGDLNSTRFPNFLGSLSNLPSDMSAGQYLYNTTTRTWFRRLDNPLLTQPIPADPSDIFTGSGEHWVGTFPTEAGAIAAIAAISNYVSADAYIFVINNVARQLLTYTPAQTATRREWRPISLSPDEARGVKIVDNVTFDLNNTLRPITNINDALLRDYDHFIAHITFDGQTGTFVFTYAQWSELPAVNSGTAIVTDNSSVQGGAMFEGSWHSAYFGRQNDAANTLLLGMRGPRGEKTLTLYGYKY